MVWQPSTVQSILTNEKYYGAAILQKTVCVDFISKKVQKNTGELPMYYIAQDHEPIITPEQFNMVKEEMQRRRDAGGLAQCVSIFSGRIVCGDCGGFYGRKVWHSSTKHTSWHWHCNNKFRKRKYCNTPTLKEESLEETFVGVFNRMIRRKANIEENYRKCLDAITDTSEYERQLEELEKGSEEAHAVIKSLLLAYSKSDGDESITTQYESYEEKLDSIARAKQELDMKIAACSAKRIQINGFLRELRKHEHPLRKFDPLVWQATVHHAQVNADCTITFVFRDGSEVTTAIKNGVRQYRKQPREESSDE